MTSKRAAKRLILNLLFLHGKAQSDAWPDDWNINPPEGPLTCANCPATTCANGGTLSFCGRCEVVEYCSRECQRAHWPAHKKECTMYRDGMREIDKDNLRKAGLLPPLPPPADPYTGGSVRILPRPGSDDVDLVPNATLNPMAHLHPRWVDLPVTQALGFPLRLAVCGYGDHRVRNRKAELLGLICDPEDPRFGQTQFPATATGAVQVARKDRGTLHIYQVHALLSWLGHDWMNEVTGVRAREANGEKVDRREIVGRLLTPEMFLRVVYLVKQADGKNEKARKEWERVKCPVEVPWVAARLPDPCLYLAYESGAIAKVPEEVQEEQEQEERRRRKRRERREKRKQKTR